MEKVVTSGPRDKGLVAKLGIEEKHEFLQNTLPLYCKITLALIPPLQCSLGFAMGHDEDESKNDNGALSDHGDNSRDSNTNNSETSDAAGPRSSASGTEAPLTDDVDVAVPLGADSVLESFLGMLATALAVDSLKNIRNNIHERLGIGLEVSRPKLVGYSLYESSSEDSEEELGDQDLTFMGVRSLKSAMPASESLKADEEFTIRNRSDAERCTQRSDTERSTHQIHRERSTTKSEDQTLINKSDVSNNPRVTEMKRTDTTSTMNSEDPLMTFAEIIQPETFYIPPPKERSVLQKSMMKNMSLTTIADRVLIKSGDELEEPENESDQDFLRWLTGEKLRDSFMLSDDDYYYARFSAWLIKDVLLQGHVHVTRDALCFYSLLPNEAPEVEPNNSDLTLYSGSLGHKLGHYGDSYFTSVYTHQFWGVLKPHSMCIYTSPTEQYFPVKVIDLNEASYCEIENFSPSQATTLHDLPPLPVNMTRSNSETLLSQLTSESSSLTDEALVNEDVQSGVWFKIVCKDKTYRFHTGNIYSARHWYNAITKVIFTLQNTNANREVIFKIPMSDVLDVKKNYVLTGELDEKNYDNNTPVSFTVKFATLPQTNSKIEKMKMKSNIAMSRTSPHDFVNILFFIGGVDFEKLMNLIFTDKVGGALELPLNTRVRLKAKKMLDPDALSIKSKHHSTFISTLNPQIPGVSLIDKIVKTNEQIVQFRNLERQRYDAELSSSETVGEKKKTMARLLNVIKPRYLGSGCTSPTGVKESISIDSKLWDDRMDKAFENWEDGLALQFPKPFSVQTLQNLRLIMVTKRRSFDEIARKFKDSPLLEEIKMQHQVKLRKKNMRNGSITSVNESSTIDFGESMRKMYLTDDSSLSISAPQKKSKFQSFKQSVRTVSSMGGIWSADPLHYQPFGVEDPYYIKEIHERQSALSHYQKHFSLAPDTFLVSAYYAYLRRTFPIYGKLYLGNDRLCFRRLFPGVSTRMIIPIKEITSCTKIRSFKFGIKVLAQGGKELVLEFATRKIRDDAFHTIWLIMEKFGIEKPKDADTPSDATLQDDENSVLLGKEFQLREDAIELAKKKIRAAKLRLLEDRVGAASGIEFPVVLEDNPFVMTEIVPTEPYNITLLTIGSRGDVQPYIALGKGLIAEGHNVTIATHVEFKEWIETHGIGFKEVAGNPAELMSLMVTHGSMSVSFLKEANSKFKGWITELLDTSWKACEGTDILIESPSAMGGIHIAEALGIPYLRAFTMPWTRTRAYPHAFIVPDSKKGGSYNILTHVMFENVFWKGISSQVNRWRVETLGLSRTNLVKLQQSRIPFLYNVSPAMFPPSVDFPDWVKVTGYWFLDEGSQDYEPPKALVEFIETAKTNNEKLVYIGFGSIVVSDAKKLTRAVIEAVLELGVKCILNKGWSDRLNKSKDDSVIELPPQIFDSGSIPHDWLFNQIDAAVHHGGSGTTGATLRAGLPTIIKPFFGDQFFYASRVEELGVGIALKKLNTKSLSKALNAITGNTKYLQKAQAVSLAMQTETGVLTAIAAIYTELAYSKSIITTIRQNTEVRKNLDDKSGVQTPTIDESSITFVAGGRDEETDDDDDDEALSDTSEEESDSSEEEDEFESGTEAFADTK